MPTDNSELKAALAATKGAEPAYVQMVAKEARRLNCGKLKPTTLDARKLAALETQGLRLRAALADNRSTVGLIDRMLDNMIYNLSSMPKEPLSSAITGLKNVKEFTTALHAKMRAAALAGDEGGA